LEAKSSRHSTEFVESAQTAREQQAEAVQEFGLRGVGFRDAG
jgi:hypothetical protein